jgi:hypothetical protein
MLKMLSITKNAPETGGKGTTTLLYVALAIATIIFAFVYSISSRVTPYADEWMMVLYRPVSVLEFIKWMFTAYFDHRIVIQRLIQQSIIYINGYDFRTLTLVNTLMMVIASWLMLKIFRAARGRSSWFDLAIIASICTPGSSAVTWSGDFCFPATNLAVIAFAHAWMLQVEHGLTARRQYYALATLIAGTLVSTGGMVASSALLLGLILLYYFRREISQPLNKYQFAIAFVICNGAWLFYEPSEAVGIRFDRIIDFIVGVSGGSLYLDHWGHEKLKDVLMLCAITTTGLVMLCGLLKHEQNPERKLPIVAIFLATSAVAFSVIGRTAYKDWAPDLARHYAITTAPIIPIICFTLSETKAGRPIAILLLLLSLVSYQHSLKSVKINLKASRENNELILRRLVESNDPQQTLSDHWLDYWYQDGNRILIPPFANEVRYLQQHGGRMYEKR